MQCLTKKAKKLLDGFLAGRERLKEEVKKAEQKIQELTQKVAEKDEQMKNMGLQLHKLKMTAAPADKAQEPQPEEPAKKRGLFK